MRGLYKAAAQLLLILSILVPAAYTNAGVLPDDRADALYHSYDGGGIEITGPSILVLKKVNESFALSGNYYVDTISSASIDVITTASAYSEERTEVGIGGQYMHGNSIMSLSYTNSTENDFDADTAHLGVSMDMFGGLTTVSMGYSVGRDQIGKTDDSSFQEAADRQNYRLGVTQIVTKDMLMEMNLEVITDEGFLNNPYRTVRYVDGGGFSYEPEVYPRTRTSTAIAVRSRYYLPWWRGAVHGEYRFFDDTWGINAHNIDVGYTHPLASGWVLDAHFRHYTQTAADFYSDLFPFEDSQNFLARDKELSTFSSNTIGVSVSYEFAKNGWKAIDKGTLNFSYDRIMFDYDDFRDLTDTSSTVGNERLYSFDADVFQVFVSLWF